jgi:hypothetical protein
VLRASTFFYHRHPDRRALVVGNGLSRANFDLAELYSYGLVVFGCNALYRDFDPDYLVVVDAAMVQEVGARYDGVVVMPSAEELACIEVSTDLLRAGWLEYDGLPEPTAGARALWCALRAGCPTIFLIGFDSVPLLPNGRNNCVYAGTTNYDYTYAHPQETEIRRVRAVANVVEAFDARHRVHQVDTSALPVSSMSYSEMFQIISRPSVRS